MSHLHESNTLRDIVRAEDESAGQLSRETLVVAAGQNLAIGAVVGKITKSTPTTGTAASGNKGGGTVASVTAGLKAKIGTYTIKCLTYVASPLAATFQVTDPDGLRLPDATLAAYTSDAINFDIADGSPVITVGDVWTIAVAAGSGQIKEISLTAVDGTSEAEGIMAEAVDATSAAKNGVVINKDAVIVSANLVWPTTSPAWSTAQKNAALATLYDKGIVARTEA